MGKNNKANSAITVLNNLTASLQAVKSHKLPLHSCSVSLHNHFPKLPSSSEVISRFGFKSYISQKKKYVLRRGSTNSGLIIWLCMWACILRGYLSSGRGEGQAGGRTRSKGNPSLSGLNSTVRLPAAWNDPENSLSNKAYVSDQVCLTSFKWHSYLLCDHSHTCIQKYVLRSLTLPSSENSARLINVCWTKYRTQATATMETIWWFEGISHHSQLAGGKTVRLNSYYLAGGGVNREDV